MKYILLIFSLFILNACTQVDSQSDIVKVESLDPTDSDCDGVVDALDVCPGGNDTVDNNGDGLPDCKFPPSNISQVITGWKCSGGTKVQVCSKSAGGFKTVCTYFSAVQNHINAGGYLGPCGNASCNQ